MTTHEADEAPTIPLDIPPPSPRTPLRNFTRWRAAPGSADLHADLLGTLITITARPVDGTVRVVVDHVVNPDEARLIGVRLIEAAALADSIRAIRFPR